MGAFPSCFLAPPAPSSSHPPPPPPPWARSAAKRKEAVAAAVTVGVATMLTNPLVAEAAVTPSLKNLLNSVVAGGVVLATIAGAIGWVSNFDKVGGAG